VNTEQKPVIAEALSHVGDGWKCVVCGESYPCPTARAGFEAEMADLPAASVVKPCADVAADMAHWAHVHGGMVCNGVRPHSVPLNTAICTDEE